MKKHMFWIMEVFIWGLILIVISGGIMLAKYNYKKSFNTYQIFLPDVDGMIDGSPVRLLGIQVGYVSQINIVGEDVYVKFIITEKNIKIPPGTRATVEFSGLGGSKSLELYPPTGNVNPSGKLIIPQNPKRIHDSFSVLNEMYENIVDITYTCSTFMQKLGVIKNQTEGNSNKKFINRFLDFSNVWIDNAQKGTDKVTKKLDKIKNNKKGEDYGQKQN